MIAATLSGCSLVAAAVVLGTIQVHSARAEHRRAEIVKLLAKRQPAGLTVVPLADQLGREIDAKLQNDLDALEEGGWINCVLEPNTHPHMPQRPRYTLADRESAFDAFPAAELP